MPEHQPAKASPAPESQQRPRASRDGRRTFRSFIRLAFWSSAVLLLSAMLLTFSAGGRSVLTEALRKTPFIYAWWAWRADNPVCSWWHGAMGLMEFDRTVAAQEQSEQNARLVRTDEYGHQLWETPLGSWWYPKGASKRSIHFSLAQYKLAAYPGLEIRRGDIVLDCGGFVGDWAHWVLRAGAARVIIFEPAAGQIECIRRNLAGPLQDGRVVLVTKGVWDREELLTLSHWDDNPAGHSVAVNRGPSGETVQLTTIDAAVRELGLQQLDVIKMDIEGAEVRALQGARETLNRFRPRLAVATEHTSDFLQNNRDVIAVVKQVAPFYSHRCGYCRLDRTGKIIPETLYFDPR